MSGEQIKPGYKRTEVGVIPEDWAIKPISACCDYVDYRGKTPPKATRGRFLVTARNVRSGFIDYEESQEYIPEELYEQVMSRGKPQIGDVLITTEAPLGNVAQIDREDIALAQRVIKYRPKSSNLSSNYLLHYFLSTRFQSILNDHSSGSTAKGIKGSVLYQLPLVIPTFREQNAIATALSDVDALLTKLDQLIAKKRDLKQATMQQLLTGQIRLPGFSGEWEVKRLGEVASLYQPTTISASVFTKDGYPVYGANGIVGYYHDFNHAKPQVTVTCRGSTCGTVNMTADKSWITGNAMVVNCDNSNLIEKDFLYQLLLNQDLTACITGSGQPQIVRGPLANFAICIPFDLDEQSAIANILCDIDAEFAVLEARRDKTRALKQGMMQELLTGRIRLI